MASSSFLIFGEILVWGSKNMYGYDNTMKLSDGKNNDCHQYNFYLNEARNIINILLFINFLSCVKLVYS